MAGGSYNRTAVPLAVLAITNVALRVGAGVLAFMAGRSVLAHNQVAGAVFGTLALLLIAVLLLPPALRLNCVVALVSTYTAILVVDVALALLVNAHHPEPRRNSDHRSMLHVIQDLNGDGIDAVPNIEPDYWPAIRDGNDSSFFTLSGISNHVTVLCNESGEFVSYRSDERGFRNPHGLWDAPQLELALVGDSYTQGMCVRDSTSFADLIRQRHPRTLNLGMSGDGPLLELATLREYLPGLRPPVVLWFFYGGNDLDDLRFEYGFPELKGYLSPGFTQSLATRQAEIDRKLGSALLRAVRDPMLYCAQLGWECSSDAVAGGPLHMRSLSHLLRILSLLHLRTFIALAIPPLDQLDRLQMVLRLADTTVASWGGRLYFVYLPTYEDAGSFGGPSAIVRSRVLRVVRELRIPIIDVTPAFQRGRREELFYGYWTHYSERGQAVVAKAVLQTIGW